MASIHAAAAAAAAAVPHLTVLSKDEYDEELQFRLSNIHVSYANAFRRTILSDIPIVVFQTSPYEKNQCTFFENTTRFTNEIIKQRLSCVPIHLDPYADNAQETMANLKMVLQVNNQTDSTRLVTTKDFQLVNMTTNAPLSEDDVRRVFPPFIAPDGEEYFIEFLRLQSKLSEEIPGGSIHLECTMSLASAREDGMFNVAGTCSYGYTVDKELQKQLLAEQVEEWKQAGKTEAEIAFQAKNWKLLEGVRAASLQNSFDFVLKTVGVYSNWDIVLRAGHVLLQKLKQLKSDFQTNRVLTRPSETTMECCFDVVLANEDYTLGNLLNYELYEHYYPSMLSYVGFKKIHPHDTDSLLRLAFVDVSYTEENVRSLMELVIDRATQTVAHVVSAVRRHVKEEDRV